MATRPQRPAPPKRTTSRTPMIVAIAVVVLVAAVVFGGVFLAGNGADSAQNGGIPAAPAPAQYATTVADGVVTAGGPAPRTLDVYEDALCPACQAFEQRYGDQIAQATEAGRLQVRYHLVNLLDQRSSPPGYSSAAGNAMMCAAENNAFPAVHASLYAAQPSEGSRAYDTAQLIDLGQRAGAGPGYAECVTDGRHLGEIAVNFQDASNDPALQRNGGFGTPTVVLDGRVVQAGSPELEQALAG